MNRFLIAISFAGIGLLSLAPQELVDHVRTPFPAAIEHAIAYTVLGFLVILLWPKTSIRISLIAFVLIAFFAIALESLQLTVPGRSFWVSDIVGSIAGAAIGITIGSVLKLLALTVKQRRNHLNHSGIRH